jgi:hypothetical protein
MNINFFVNSQNLPHQLTQELAIQREKNGQFVFGVKHKATAEDIDDVASPSWSNGSDSFRQFKVMCLSGKPAFIKIKTIWKNIRI